jgi:hypothetical protein
MTPSCRHHTASCIVLPARAYRVWPTGSPAILCDPCAGELRSMGLALDERPEWVRRAAERRLPAKDLSHHTT